ncbi:MAG: hypothetical protein AB7O26_00840 [Planctomycetaceae bacterium]
MPASVNEPMVSSSRLMHSSGFDIAPGKACLEPLLTKQQADGGPLHLILIVLRVAVAHPGPNQFSGVVIHPTAALQAFRRRHSTEGRKLDPSRFERRVVRQAEWTQFAARCFCHDWQIGKRWIGTARVARPDKGNVFSQSHQSRLWNTD